MANNDYDKKKLIILRFALILIGAGMGYLALWQYFLYYPNVVRHEFQIVIAVVSSALIALILGLSAKAFYRLFSSVGESLRDFGGRVGARGIVAVALGFSVAVALTVGFDFGIRYVIEIWAVRLLADVLACIVFAALCCYGFTKWLNAAKTKHNTPQPVGYLIAAECFTDERVISAAHSLINAKVCDGAFKALCLYGNERGIKAAKLMDELIKCGKLDAVRTVKPFDDVASYTEVEKSIAFSNRLRLVEKSGVTDGALALDIFAPPTAELKNALKEQAEKRESVSNEIGNSSTHEVVNGQIIIDK